jgi:hypothetical protein
MSREEDTMTVVNAVPRVLGLFLAVAAVILLAGFGLSEIDLDLDERVPELDGKEN